MEASRRTAAALICLAACGSKEPPPAASRGGKVLAALLAAADHARAPWRCAATDTPALPDEDLAGWKLSGRTLARDGDDITIGVIADAGGAAPRTLAALGRLRALFGDVDLIVSLGGMGTTEPELEASLGALGGKTPIVALPGDLEDTGAHVAAIAALRKKGIAVLDGRLVRWIETPGLAVATLPGAGAVERLAAGNDGCAWRTDDIAKLYADITAKPGLRIVASSEAPRTTIGGEPAGELALVPPQPVDIALHAPLQAAPSPAKTGGRNGTGVALSPGTSDATTRLPRAHTPSAGLLAIKGASWSWRPLVDTK